MVHVFEIHDEGPPPLWVGLRQLQRAAELAESIKDRARDGAEPRITFRSTEGMRMFDKAVIIEASVYRGGGDDSFEILVDVEGNVLLEWSSDKPDKPT